MIAWLLDSNILLRGVDRSDPQYALTLKAVGNLVEKGGTLYFTLQGLTEFWNVSTRPATVRGGLGLSIEETEKRLRVIERIGTFVADTEDVRVHWRRLVVKYRVQGVQVHDARLVASMLAHDITHLLTFNIADFRRYPEISVVHPEDMQKG